MWAVTFPDNMVKICGEVKSFQQIVDAIKKVEDCEIVVEKDRVIDIIFPRAVDDNDDNDDDHKEDEQDK